MLCKISVIIVSVLSVHLCLIFLLPATTTTVRDSMGNSRLVVIDTDAGGDDAVAILLALAVDEVQVVAITCSYGNTDEDKVETNVLKILTVAGRSDIPVYGGAKRPLLKKYKASEYFGKDGFGDFQFDGRLIGSIDRSKHAAIALIELAKTYRGEISVVALGPLTNIALAASLDPTFTQNVQRFYVMGSRVDELKNAKNASLEFNFGLDPEGNAIFLKEPTNLTTLVTPYDVVHSNTIDMKWRMKILGTSDSAVAQFLNKAESVVLKNIPDKWSVADSITVATMIWPELVTESLEAHMSADLHSPLGSGSVIVEANGYSAKRNNVEIIRGLNMIGFQEKLLRYLA
ncbi:pyrimidine-specific ribonucleoside hydrolase RihA isoform X2 [Nasonia vitripennis]|uniref:Inosine/uridine-preferring nucleoside hydrolase domain-containing protein n=1 Tax=Nasonia vitripennis TaxID=7425 RepID=A0A7M7J2M0_NASVI|nr:pyrimidine-specific ribonucleoside hydrolase RihA isoform X2 [Nasonia vitripennis]